MHQTQLWSLLTQRWLSPSLKILSGWVTEVWPVNFALLSSQEVLQIRGFFARTTTLASTPCLTQEACPFTEASKVSCEPRLSKTSVFANNLHHFHPTHFFSPHCQISAMGVEGRGQTEHLPLIAGMDSYSLTVTLLPLSFPYQTFIFGHATWLAGSQLLTKD